MITVLEQPAFLKKVPVSPEPIYRLLFGRPMTEILLAAVDLRIFETLTRHPQTLEELSHSLHLPVHSLDMLLNTCTALGLLQKNADRFENTVLSNEFLVSDRPFYLGGLIGHFRAHVYPAWDYLKDAIREDGPQLRKTVGEQDIFKVTQQTDVQTELFISAMHNLSVSDGIVLAEGFDFSRFKRLLDVGGGSGALSLAIAAHTPGLQAIVYDRPQVCAIADRYIAASGLTKQVQTYAGDVFSNPLPEGVDVILMSLFIHAFGLERSTPLLQKCFAALPSGGLLLIYEPMLDPSRSGPLTTLLSSLNMLVVTPSGGDVTAQDYMTWLKQTGFESVFHKALPSVRHLVGGFKP